MIRFREIRSAIVQGISAATGLRVIEMNDSGPVEEYPYITYDFSVFPDESRGQAAVSFDGTHKTFTETVEFTVSFNSYAAYKEESVENAMRVREWLLYSAGREQLRDTANVVVVRSGPVQNRDVEIGAEWERRHGFEVDFRTLNTIKLAEYSIDSAEIRRS